MFWTPLMAFLAPNAAFFGRAADVSPSVELAASEKPAD
jgi:hypothetical protein